MRCNIGTCVGSTCSNGIKNSTIAFLKPQQLKWGSTWHFVHMMSLALASLSHYANSIINCTIAFIRLWQLKWDATWLFWSCDATGVDLSVKWSWWCHQGNITFLILYWKQPKWGTTWCFCHWHHWYQCWCIVKPTVLSMAPMHFLGENDWHEVQHDFSVM